MPPPRPFASDSAAAGAQSSRSTSEPASTEPATTTSTGSPCGSPCSASTSSSTSHPSWSGTSRPWRDASVGRLEASGRRASGPGDPLDDRLGPPEEGAGETPAEEEQRADGAGEAEGVAGDHRGGAQDGEDGHRHRPGNLPAGGGGGGARSSPLAGNLTFARA